MSSAERRFEFCHFCLFHVNIFPVLIFYVKGLLNLHFENFPFTLASRAILYGGKKLDYEDKRCFDHLIKKKKWKKIYDCKKLMIMHFLGRHDIISKFILFFQQIPTGIDNATFVPDEVNQQTELTTEPLERWKKKNLLIWKCDIIIYVGSKDKRQVFRCRIF